MNILVTGGAGFIGSHLVERLLSEDHRVTVIDNMNTGKVENLPKDKRLKLVVTDILEDIDADFEGKDVVFHLAALTRPQWSIEHPLESDHVNVHGTLKVLNHCYKNKVKRVVLASSSSLYGTPSIFPTPETEPPRSMSPYAIQKYMTELYAKLFERMYGLEVNCVRPFNVYGTRQNPAGGYAAAVPKFIELLNQNKPGNITGDGEQTRDFTYVDDVVDLMVKAAMSDVFGESFNAGAGRSVSINYVYNTISKIMGKDIAPNYIPAVFEPPRTFADTTKAQKLLGWKPKTNLEDGLRITVEGTI